MSMKSVAIYARVASIRQQGNHAIENQTATLIEYAERNELHVPTEWIFKDEGYSGVTLERPGLASVRTLAAGGQIRAVLVCTPDRLSRNDMNLNLLIEEFARNGVETRFVVFQDGDTPPGSHEDLE
jgi:site-specific DNA recombinase